MARKVEILGSFSYVPLEETLEIVPRKKQLFIGIPRESTYQENRVALTPDAVSVLINNGHKVVVEHDAGKHASFSDQDFSEAGAVIVYDKESVYKADLIVK